MKLKDYKKIILCQISIKTPLNHNMDLIMVQILDNIIKNKITRKIKVLNINFNPNQKFLKVFQVGLINIRQRNKQIFKENKIYNALPKSII